MFAIVLRMTPLRGPSGKMQSRLQIPEALRQGGSASAALQKQARRCERALLRRAVSRRALLRKGSLAKREPCREEYVGHSCRFFVTMEWPSGLCGRSHQIFCDKPTKKPRRGPYCGAKTPMPVPLRFSE